MYNNTGRIVLRRKQAGPVLKFVGSGGTGQLKFVVIHFTLEIIKKNCTIGYALCPAFKKIYIKTFTVFRLYFRAYRSKRCQ